MTTSGRGPPGASGMETSTSIGVPSKLGTRPEHTVNAAPAAGETCADGVSPAGQIGVAADPGTGAAVTAATTMAADVIVRTAIERCGRLIMTSFREVREVVRRRGR